MYKEILLTSTDMYMNPNKPIIFKAEQLDWEKLEAVGTCRKEL